MCQPRRTNVNPGVLNYINLPTSYRGHVKKVINGYLDATTGEILSWCAMRWCQVSGQEKQKTAKHSSVTCCCFLGANEQISISLEKSTLSMARARAQNSKHKFSAPVFYAASLLATWETCFDREPCMLPVLFSAGQDCASLQDPWASLCRGFKWAKGRLGASYGRT